jgi:outer membrane protein assembly factor BamE (lipoprotein component of BamABCDE complex)
LLRLPAALRAVNKAASEGGEARDHFGQNAVLCMHRGASELRKLKPVSVRAALPALVALSLGTCFLAACGAQIDRHGHVFIDVDLHQVQPGMTKDQVKTVLGSPDTTSTINGDAYYYISTTQKTVAFLKDGIVVNYYKGETPARGKDLSVLEQIFGNISNRKLFKDQRPGMSGIPGPGL